MSPSRPPPRIREHVFALLYLSLMLVLAVGEGLLPGRSLTMAYDLALSDQAYGSYSAVGPLDPIAPRAIRPSDSSPTWFAYPMDVLAARQFHAGEWPTWNPFNGFGAPHLAAGESAPFFPLKLLFYLAAATPASTMAAYGWFLAARLLVAGIGAYAYARSIGIGLAGALVSAQGFMFCGFVLTDFQHVDSTPTVLLPLVAWTIEAVFRRLPGAAVACGLALGITALSGHPESALFVLLGTGVYAFARLLTVARERLPVARGALGRLTGAALLGLALSCIGALPLLELMRARPSYVSAGNTTTVSLHTAAEQYWGLAAGYLFWPVIAQDHPLRPRSYFFIVNLFGGPLVVWAVCLRFFGALRRLPAPLWVLAGVPAAAALLLPPLALLPSPLRAQSYYTTPLLCFVLAVLSGWAVDQVAAVRGAAPRWRAVLGATIVSLLLFVGLVHPAGWFVPAIAACVRLARGPVGRSLATCCRLVLARRDGVLTGPGTTPAGLTAIALGWALAAVPIVALGLPPLARTLLGATAMTQRHLATTPSGAGAALAIAVLWSASVFVALPAARQSGSPVARLGLAALAVLLTGAVGVGSAHRIIAPAPALLYPETPAVAAIRSAASGFRFAALDADVLRGNSATVYGIHDLRLSYVFHSCRYRLYMAAINEAGQAGSCRAEQFSNNVAARRAFEPLLAAASVSVAAVKDSGARDVGLPERWAPVWRAGDLALYQLPGVVPRAYWVGASRRCANGGRAALITLAIGEVDLAREVLLEEGVADASREPLPRETPDQCDPPAPAVQGGEVRVADYRAARVRIETNANVSGHVVLTEAAAPGWTATVDGAAAPVFTANFAFRAVPVPAGRHVVELRYNAPGFHLGLVTTVAALVISIAALFISLFKTHEASRAALYVGALLALSLAVTIAGFAPHPSF